MSTRVPSKRLSLVQTFLLWIALVVFGVWVFALLDIKLPERYGSTVFKFGACRPLSLVAGVWMLVSVANSLLVVSLWRTVTSHPGIAQSRIIVVAGTVAIVLFCVSFGAVLLMRERLVGVCA